jgi:hypothetical protein
MLDLWTRCHQEVLLSALVALPALPSVNSPTLSGGATTSKILYF